MRPLKNTPSGFRIGLRSGAVALLLLAILSCPAPNCFGEPLQYGGTRENLRVEGRIGFVILDASVEVEGPRPWVWYAPTFIGQNPGAENAWICERLVAKGYAIAGVDVGESYGSPYGTRIYGEFYDLAREQYGLAEKPALMAQSRGGLMLYNWAIENPTRVACVVGIYPVCDIRSYPGVERAYSAFRISERNFVNRLGEFNPIDRLEPLAKAGVPVLHIHGDSDTVVPLEENSRELATRYRSLGGDAEVIVVPGKGHEAVPEFFHRQELLDFLLEHTQPAEGQ
jgi:pimeloyl-ACP methyl ester carboxylesterase